MHWWIDVAERPFVRGKLAVGMHVPLARQQHELLFGETRIHDGESECLKCQVPRGVPRVLPLVRHRENIGIVQVGPLVIPSTFSLGRRRRLAWVALQPLEHVVVIKLLAPDQAR